MSPWICEHNNPKISYSWLDMSNVVPYRSEWTASDAGKIRWLTGEVIQSTNISTNAKSPPEDQRVCEYIRTSLRRAEDHIDFTGGPGVVFFYIIPKYSTEISSSWPGSNNATKQSKHYLKGLHKPHPTHPNSSGVLFNLRVKKQVKAALPGKDGV